MDVSKDPLYLSLHRKSYALDDWRAKLLLGILQQAIDEFLGKRVSRNLRAAAEHFLFYDGNMMFDLCISILDVDRYKLREELIIMKYEGRRLKKEGSKSKYSYN